MLQTMIDNLALAAAPCALFAMGVTLALRPLKRRAAGDLCAGALEARGTAGADVSGNERHGRLPGGWVETAVLLAALPTRPMSSSSPSNMESGRSAPPAAVLITTVISVASVSGALYLFKSGALPPDLFP